MKIYTENLVKKYRTRTVVDHVSIEVEQGEIVGLLGPNGAGKTTSFYMIVGLIRPRGLILSLVNLAFRKSGETRGYSFQAEKEDVQRLPGRWHSSRNLSCS